jgi:beta-galactosidase
VALSNAALFARVHKGEKGSFLWLVNPTRTAQKTEVTLARGALAQDKATWPIDNVSNGGIVVPPRDVLILPLG